MSIPTSPSELPRPAMLDAATSVDPQSSGATHAKAKGNLFEPSADASVHMTGHSHADTGHSLADTGHSLADTGHSLADTVRALRAFSPTPPSFACVLGSGFDLLTEAVSNPRTLPYEEVPGMPHCSVQGHAGQFVFGTIGGTSVCLLRGRAHLYEGHSPFEVVRGVRAIALMGTRNVMLTNAAGGVAEHFVPGDLMLIEDHLNLSGCNPLQGENPSLASRDGGLRARLPNRLVTGSPASRDVSPKDFAPGQSHASAGDANPSPLTDDVAAQHGQRQRKERPRGSDETCASPQPFGPRFPDMGRIYDRAWMAQAMEAGGALGIPLRLGIYAGMLGPSYETPAEVKMLRAIGADAVGMSTVLEAIALCHAGAKVLGLSCIANKAAGMADETLTHEDVQAVVQASGARAATLLERLLAQDARPNP